MGAHRCVGLGCQERAERFAEERWELELRRPHSGIAVTDEPREGTARRLVMRDDGEERGRCQVQGLALMRKISRKRSMKAGVSRFSVNRGNGFRCAGGRPEVQAAGELTGVPGQRLCHSCAA